MHCGGTGGCRGSIPQVLTSIIVVLIVIINVIVFVIVNVVIIINVIITGIIVITSLGTTTSSCLVSPPMLIILIGPEPQVFPHQYIALLLCYVTMVVKSVFQIKE